jgi:hypothetical protein
MRQLSGYQAWIDNMQWHIITSGDVGMKIQARVSACAMVNYVGLLFFLQLVAGCTPKNKPVTVAPPPPAARPAQSNAATPALTRCVTEPTTNADIASLTQIQSMAQSITDDEFRALSNAQQLAALQGAALLKEVVRDPLLWQRLPDEKARLDWVLTVFYQTYPDGVAFVMPALLMLTNANDLTVAARAGFVLGVSQMRSGDYETARRTFAAGMEKQLGSQTMEEAARSMDYERKLSIDRLLKARAILAAKAQWKQNGESELYWWSERLKVFSESEVYAGFTHEQYAYALMNAGRRAEAIAELEKTVSLMSNQNIEHKKMRDRLQAWKEGSDESEAYDL